MDFFDNAAGWKKYQKENAELSENIRLFFKNEMFLPLLDLKS